MYVALGYIGGSILAVQHIPQITHVWANRSARDLSLGFIVSNLAGLTCMLLYALSTNDYPIAIPVGISLVFSGVLGVSKMYIDSTETSL